MKRRITRIALCLFLLLTTIWVSLSPLVSPGLYSDKLFQPHMGKGSQAELDAFDRYEHHQTWFPTASGEKINGRIFLNPESDKIILFLPGNAGDIPKRLPLITYLLDSGASVFVYEPRGYGQSPGAPSIKSIVEDGVAAFDYVASLGYKPSQIVLYGESLGAAVATQLSTVRAHAGIILQSGFASLERIAKEKVPELWIYPGFMFPNPRFDNAYLMSRPHAPLLILHGEKDTLIDISHSEEIFARAVGPKQLVRFPHSGHSDVTGADYELFIATVSAFLDALP